MESGATKCRRIGFATLTALFTPLFLPVGTMFVLFHALKSPAAIQHVGPGTRTQSRRFMLSRERNDLWLDGDVRGRICRHFFELPNAALHLVGMFPRNKMIHAGQNDFRKQIGFSQRGELLLQPRHIFHWHERITVAVKHHYRDGKLRKHFLHFSQIGANREQLAVALAQRLGQRSTR